MNVIVRDAEAGDIAAMQAIYAHEVLNGLGTFDAVPPTTGEFEGKWRTCIGHGLSWLVAMEDGLPIGYAYASLFRPRPGYRYTVEDSVYIRHDRKGRGVGSALLPPLIDRCAAIGVRQMVAVIGDSGNAGSIGLHRKAGFTHAGAVKGAGYKFGRWVDIVLMQLALNGGDSGVPPAGGGWRT